MSSSLLPRRITAVLALTLCSSLSVAQNEVPTITAEYQRLNQILDEIESRGYTRIGEFDRELFGRIEVEAVDSASLEHKLVFDGEGKLIRTRAQGGTDAADALDVAAVRRVLVLLQAQGYHDIEQISADDGFIEVEASNAEGQAHDLTLDMAAQKVLVSQRDSWFDDLSD